MQKNTNTLREGHMTNFTRRSAITMMAAAGLAPRAYAESATKKPKVAFMFIGEPGEVGWNYEHARAVQMARDTFGDRVQIDQFAGIGEWGNGDKEKLAELVADGYDMIFGCSFGYMNAMVNASFTAPHVKFEHCGGYIRSGNLSTYTARWYQGRVIEGILAGNVTKTNKIAYIASFPIPQIMRGVNAAFVAARSVNPNVELDVVWLNTWFDPEAEEKAARELIANGVDVLMQHTNTSKPMEVAQELGVYACGKGSDMSKFGPDAQLTASINNWGPYYVERIQALLDGTWQSEDTWGGLQEQMFSMAPFAGWIPERAVLQAQDAMARLQDGTSSAFVGPLRRQDGSIWLADGETASDNDLLTMDFLVEGIKSEIPRKS